MKKQSNSSTLNIHTMARKILCILRLFLFHESVSNSQVKNHQKKICHFQTERKDLPLVLNRCVCNIVLYTKSGIICLVEGKWKIYMVNTETKGVPILWSTFIFV